MSLWKTILDVMTPGHPVHAERLRSVYNEHGRVTVLLEADQQFPQTAPKERASAVFISTCKSSQPELESQPLA